MDNNSLSDVLRRMSHMKGDGSSDSNDQLMRDIQQTLRNIEKDVHSTCIDIARGSQSAARDRVNGSSTFRDRYDESTSRSRSNGKKREYKGFLDELEDQLVKGILGSDVSAGVDKVLRDFGKTLADTIGVELEDVPGALGREMGSQLMKSFKNTALGSEVTRQAQELRKKASSSLQTFLFNNYNSGVEKYLQAAGSNATGSGAALAGLGQIAGAGGSAVVNLAQTALTHVSGILSTAGTAIAAINPVVLAGGLAAVGVGLLALKVASGDVTKSFKRLKEGLGNFSQAVSAAADRYENSKSENLKYAQTRFYEDVKAIIEQPFTILQEAAEAVQSSWDSSLRTINATQGYTKADLQSLQAAYAQRLRQEGLTSYISGADITTNLVKVLESGMSGRVAEEFAYLATKLQAAIPTQDFFGYADTYVQLAANRIKAGYSEAEAIAYANEQMQLFASNVLYANRQLTGGFTTGLKNAENILEQAVRIAEASKTGDVSLISGVLASVSAITGSIAPDLTSSIIDAVVKAATGGNSSEIVALRSLAGINAGNTEFLRQLANNPKKVFTDLFSNLARLQTMSESNYMEVAEGLSSIFGISMDAFARIDFNYLATAISQMQVNQNSLAENMAHLQSGETTLTAEQLRYQQINEYMLEEGLSYVLDNEVARVIQQHMWDEQMHRESLEATYGVELRGSALEVLNGLRSTVKSIFNFLNPFAWLSKGANLLTSASEAAEMSDNIKRVLEAGKVGIGNKKALHNLVTRDSDLNLVNDYLTMIGGKRSASHQLFQWITSGVAGLGQNTFGLGGAYIDGRNRLIQSAVSGIDALLNREKQLSSPNSSYTWGSVSKSTANALNTLLRNTDMSNAAATTATTLSGTTAAKSSLVSRLNQMLDTKYINDKFVSQGKSYEEYVASATSFGIANFQAALEEAGYTESQVQDLFEQQAAVYGHEQNANRYTREDEFWERQNLFADTEEAYTQNLIELVTTTNNLLVSVISKQTSFQKAWEAYYHDWTEYFVKHTAYKDSFNYGDINDILRRENAEKDEAVYALAEVLSNNLKDLSDPQAQTNAILAQILLVVRALKTQRDTAPGSFDLFDSLASLATGGVVKPE